MRTRKVVWMALVVGALAFAGAVGAQPPPAGGQGGGHHGKDGAPRGGNAPQLAPNAPNPGNPGPGGPGGPGGGNPQWTPEQMQQMQERVQQRNAERMKKSLDLTDEQWEAMRPKVEKVQALEREAEMLAAGAPGRGGRGPGGFPMPGMGQTAPGTPQTELTKATQELQAALDNKDSTPEQISAKLRALRDARAQLPAELAKARAELQKGLTPRQEAQMVVMGILQ